MDGTSNAQVNWLEIVHHKERGVIRKSDKKERKQKRKKKRGAPLTSLGNVANRPVRAGADTSPQFFRVERITSLKLLWEIRGVFRGG